MLNKNVNSTYERVPSDSSFLRPKSEAKSNKKCVIISSIITIVTILCIISFYAINSYKNSNLNNDNGIMDKSLLTQQGLNLAGPHDDVPQVISDNTMDKKNINFNAPKINKVNLKSQTSDQIKDIHPVKNNAVDLKKEKIFQFSEVKSDSDNKEKKIKIEPMDLESDNTANIVIEKQKQGLQFAGPSIYNRQRISSNKLQKKNIKK